MAIGITVLRVSNQTGATVQTVPANKQIIYLEGQILGIQLTYSQFRGPTVDGPAGSIAGPKAKIEAVNIQGTTPISYTNAGGLVLELGYLDNDGYFTTHLSSLG